MRRHYFSNISQNVVQDYVENYFLCGPIVHNRLELSEWNTPLRAHATIQVTGNPGSVMVPQYSSSKMILKLVGNTK